MGLSCCAEQSIIVTAITATCRHLNQITVVRSIGGVGRFPGAGMAGDTLATADRDRRQQGRNGAVAEVTIINMGHSHCRVRSCARIVTALACDR